jgi:SAM-dependent methyltransferase
MLGFDVLLIDKDLARPTTKVLDSQRNKWALVGPTTLADKCCMYKVKTIKCDIERQRIPLDDDAVDFIVFTEIIEHLRIGLLPALRELHRVLKPNGSLLITTPNLLSLKNRWSFVIGHAQYDTLELPYDALDAEERIGHIGHFRVFSMPELVDLLQRTGFCIRYRGYHQVSTNKAIRMSLYSMRIKVYNRLIRWLPPLSNQLCVVATHD